jgi:hypothetical protein
MGPFGFVSKETKMKLTRLLFALVVFVGATGVAVSQEAEERTAADVVNDLQDRDLGVVLAAIAEAEALQDPAVSSQLTKMLKEKDREVRVAVIGALAGREAEADRKRAAQTLAARLKPLTGKAAEAVEYETVIGALAKLAQPCSIKALLDMTIEESRATALARLMAVAEVPHHDAIEALIQFGSKGRNRGTNNQHESAANALRHATGQRFGRDMDKWRAWWRENRETFDAKAFKEEREAAAAAAAEREKERREKRRQRERSGDGS